jgi:dihydroorotate dehydrogenase (fumarate)/dihydroorotate dehydrogenase
MNAYQRYIRPVLFRFDPERVHGATLTLCHALGRSKPVRRTIEAAYAFDDLRLHTNVAGIEFPNPLGLAAGFDKNGLGAGFLSRLGFGFIEIGSVSASPSPGNEIRPRLFRLPADRALMVNYGVPSAGAQAVAARIRLARPTCNVPLGINLVETNKGRHSGVEDVIKELAQAARPFLPAADYLVLNLSCPNARGGFSHFAAPENLALLLAAFGDIGHLPPLFLKIAPPSDPALTDRVLKAVDPFPFMKGFILNVHAPRPYAGLNTPQTALDAMRGTLTGPRLRKPVNEAIRCWYRQIDRSRHVLIGVGGISCAEDAYETMRLGASLVQVLTALIYAGPALLRDIKRGLVRLLKRDGFRNIAECIGVDNRPAR